MSVCAVVWVFCQSCFSYLFHNDVLFVRCVLFETDGAHGFVVFCVPRQESRTFAALAFLRFATAVFADAFACSFPVFG